jgi:RNA polymerase sigma-70 factor (ECF subfamily)
MSNETDDFLQTRRSLLTRLKHCEDREGWQAFFDTYARLIYGVARKAGLNDAEAQDAVQETIITVSQQMPGFKYDPARCSFKGWLLLITRQRIARQFGKRDKAGPSASGQAPGLPSEDTARTETLERIPDPASDPLEALWNEEWERNLLSAATERVKRQVSDSHYQIFDLYVLQGWPPRDVARTLGVSRGQVYLAKHRVGGLVKMELKRLQRELRDR